MDFWGKYPVMLLFNYKLISCTYPWCYKFLTTFHPKFEFLFLPNISFLHCDWEWASLVVSDTLMDGPYIMKGREPYWANKSCVPKIYGPSRLGTSPNPPPQKKRWIVLDRPWNEQLKQEHTTTCCSAFFSTRRRSFFFLDWIRSTARSTVLFSTLTPLIWGSNVTLSQ